MGPSSLPARILLVEDERDIRDALTEVLVDAGYLVDQAEDGLVALDRLHATRALPQLIVLDLMMPHLDGLEFRKRQLDDERLAPIPTIAVSADRRGLLRASGLAIRHVLAKPLDLDQLLETVAIYCPSPS